MSLEEKAKELAKEVMKTEEYANLNSAKARVKVDPNAQDIINELKSEQDYIQRSRLEGKPVDNDRVIKYQTLQKKAIENVTLQRLFKAQQEFGRVMQKVNETLDKELFK